MTYVPRSEQFDDVYFSAQDGLAETRHVFLEGNGLPAAWRGQKHFTICETGFGTGLNFLAVLDLWNKTPITDRPQTLRFISIEKYPLSAQDIRTSLSGWEELREYLDILLTDYPDDVSIPVHHAQFYEGTVSLSIYFADVNTAISTIEAAVDCWFLDGFRPATNPDMWSETLFMHMARLSHIGASFATFTAAGFVRRGLTAQGFDVRKTLGFGRKREMSVGTYRGEE